MGHKATSDSPIRSLHRLWREVSGEIVTLFQKRVSFNVPRDGWWYQTFGVRLTVASHRVYGWYRPRIPWIKAATLSAFCSIAV